MAFKFGNNIVRIEIENLIFRVIIDETLKEKVLSAKTAVEEIKTAAATECETDTEKTVIEKFDGLIDNILGIGAAAKIFDGRTPDGLEHISVFVYICEEITNHIDRIKENAV